MIQSTLENKKEMSVPWMIQKYQKQGKYLDDPRYE